MDPKELIEKSHKLAERYRVCSGKKFKLSKHDPADTSNLDSEDKPRAKEALQVGITALSELQERLYSQGRHGVLLIFQATDAAGKDGCIKHVMSGVNPQGCEVYSFKAPSSEDLDHDYLWRCMKRTPTRGRIGIFNRSYYEETLIVRVHPEILESQRIPKSLLTKNIWDERFEDIRSYERYLSRQGYVIIKFFLNLSKEEQKRRFLSRLNTPEKNWKFSSSDLSERKHWDAYQKAYEDMIKQTATEYAPWYVVPADNKWFSRLVVAAAVVDTLGALDLQFPQITPEKKKDLKKAKRILDLES